MWAENQSALLTFATWNSEGGDQMSAIDAAYEVLRQAGEPLLYREITRRAPGNRWQKETSEPVCRERQRKGFRGQRNKYRRTSRI